MWTSSPDNQKKESERSGRAGNRRLSRSRVTKVAYSAVFAALALIFSYVESLIPVPIPVPGIKLGLANLVVLLALYKFGVRYAILINAMRVVMAGLLFSGVFGTIYSAAGALVSMFAMYAIKRTNRFSIVGVSMAGGVFHNLSQLMTACIIVSNFGLLSYFSVLFISGLISGILIGILAYNMEKRIMLQIM